MNGEIINQNTNSNIGGVNPSSIGYEVGVQNIHANENTSMYNNAVASVSAQSAASPNQNVAPNITSVPRETVAGPVASPVVESVKVAPQPAPSPVVENVKVETTNVTNDTSKENNSSSKFSILEAYGEVLNHKTYITNPAIAREDEIKQTILILLTPDKSALLVGKPGIGKTAIVEGLAYRIQNGDIPNNLKGYDLIKVNITALLGNAVSEGQNENRLQLLVEELKQRDNIILFIDEVHLLIGKNANSSLDFANMLKPALDRGTIKMIGATTTEEYEQYILRDRAFNRRFQRIDVEEPTQETVVKILMGTYPRIEKQTGVKCLYTDFIKERIFAFLANMTSEYKRIYEVGNRYPDITLMLLANAYSYAAYDNDTELKLKHFYKAIMNFKNVYDDAKKKDLVIFKEEFKDLIAEENLNFNDY